MPRETSSFFSRDLWIRGGTGGSDCGTRPRAEWPPCDNGCYADKGKTDESGTLVMDGCGMSPPGIWLPWGSLKSSSCKRSKTMVPSCKLVSSGLLSQVISLLQKEFPSASQ